MNKYRINCRKLIRHLGGARFIAREHAKVASDMGWKPLSENTIRSWVRNNSIRSPHLEALYSLSDVTGKPLILEQFREIVP